MFSSITSSGVTPDSRAWAAIARSAAVRLLTLPFLRPPPGLAPPLGIWNPLFDLPKKPAIADGACAPVPLRSGITRAAPAATHAPGLVPGHLHKFYVICKVYTILGWAGTHTPLGCRAAAAAPIRRPRADPRRVAGVRGRVPGAGGSWCHPGGAGEPPGASRPTCPFSAFRPSGYFLLRGAA
jgi:hypothetical protein